jgi:hypothetical protein
MFEYLIIVIINDKNFYYKYRIMSQNELKDPIEEPIEEIVMKENEEDKEDKEEDDEKEEKEDDEKEEKE